MSLDILLKIGFLLVSFSYIVFLLIVLIQMLSMERVIKEIHDSVILRAVMAINIIAAISLFFLAFVIL